MAQGVVVPKRFWTMGKIVGLVLARVLGIGASGYAVILYNNDRAASSSHSITPQCKGTAACFTDSVTYIVDGDTLDVGSTRIRLTLVNTPEVGQPGYTEAKDFTAQHCSVGSQALVDEDDGQTGGSYGRTIAVVYCGGANLNAELLSTGLAVLVTYYCGVSEFASETWTGCP